MDAAGKDGTIKHVMSGINPQGCQVYSFKQPSAEELDHDYLWRINRSLPERGRIGIFNRSHYEDVLIAKVHPEIILSNKLPGVETINDIDPDFWKRRYRQINDFERYLTENGTIVLKFFLNVSKAEQKIDSWSDWTMHLKLEILFGGHQRASILGGLYECLCRCTDGDINGTGSMVCNPCR